MSVLTEALTAAERHIDYSGRADIPDEAFDVLRALVGDVEALKEAVSRPSPTDFDMSRAEALKTARDHVEAMSTKANGYQDTKLSDKIQAVDRLARFLMGESE